MLNRFLIIVALSVAMVGCAHNKGNVGLPTPYQQVLTSNAILAETNKDVAKSVIQLKHLGTIPAATADDILAVQKRIAQIDKDLSVILALGPDAAKGQSEQIQSLITELKNLCNDPALNLSQDVKTKVSAILISADNILVGLRQAGVL